MPISSPVLPKYSVSDLPIIYLFIRSTPGYQCSPNQTVNGGMYGKEMDGNNDNYEGVDSSGTLLHAYVIPVLTVSVTVMNC